MGKTHVRGILLAALLLPLHALAQDAIGRVLTSDGQVTARAANGSERNLTRRNELSEQETLLTGPDAFLAVRLVDDAQLALGPNTELRIDRYRFDGDPATPDAALLTLVRGCVRVLSGQIGGPPDEHRIETPLASILMRGTFQQALYDGAALYTGTLEGATTISNAQGSVVLGLGGTYDFSRTLPDMPPQGRLGEPPQLGACSRVPNNTSSTNGVLLQPDQDYSAGPTHYSAAPSAPAAARPGP